MVFDFIRSTTISKIQEGAWRALRPLLHNDELLQQEEPVHELLVLGSENLEPGGTLAAASSNFQYTRCTSFAVAQTMKTRDRELPYRHPVLHFHMEDIDTDAI